MLHIAQSIAHKYCSFLLHFILCTIICNKPQDYSSSFCTVLFSTIVLIALTTLIAHIGHLFQYLYTIAPCCSQQSLSILLQPAFFASGQLLIAALFSMLLSMQLLTDLSFKSIIARIYYEPPAAAAAAGAAGAAAAASAAAGTPLSSSGPESIRSPSCTGMIVDS